MRIQKGIHELAAAFLCALLLVVGGDGSSEQRRAATRQAFSRSTLKIATPDAQLHKIDVWIADNDARRQRGLMSSSTWPDDAGMLFIYPQPQPISMWMKNTHLSLDMLFVSANGRVDSIAENTKPMSTDTISSKAMCWQ
jgi:uncharacterized membrane protein (UPF0127 family)